MNQMPTDVGTKRRTAREPKPTKKGEGYIKQLQHKNRAKDVDVHNVAEAESSSTTTTTDVAVTTLGT